MTVNFLGKQSRQLIVFAVMLLLIFVHVATGVGLAQAQQPSGLSVLVSEVLVEGGFQELSGATEELISLFQGRRSTVEELYDLAHGLELLYQQAGYFLVRVTIPPQEVNDGDTFRLIVVDGYLEGVDLQGVPERTRFHVESLLQPIVNRPQLTMDDFERVLMLVNQTPGTTVRTTLTPGEGVGTSVLIVEGEHSGFDASARFNKRVSDVAAPWNASAQVQLNQPFGRGEQLSVNVSEPATSLLSVFRENVNHRSYGGAIRWPIGNDGTSLHMKYSETLTYTPSPHWIIPDTRSDFRRISLELSKPQRLSRSYESRFTVMLEAIDQTLEAPDFQIALYQDGLRVLRLGGNSRWESATSSRLSLSWQTSHGLAWGARTIQDVQETGIPFSRFDAKPGFQKLTMNGSWRLPLKSGFTLTSTVRGQYALIGPLPTAELFSLSGENGLPSLALGIGANDHGWTVREEVNNQFSLLNGKLRLTVLGYIAAGRTDGDMSGMNGFTSAVGLGLRGDIGRVRLSLEHSRGWSEWSSDDALIGSMEVSF